MKRRQEDLEEDFDGLDFIKRRPKAEFRREASRNEKNSGKRNYSRNDFLKFAFKN